MVVLFGHLRRTAGRAAALVVAVLVAATGFTVLTGTARTSQLQVVGTVRANSRSAYDILLRPKGTRSAVERSRGLVRGDFLSGIYGGITQAQYAEVAHTRGVSVAAPVAILGYLMPEIDTTIDVTALLASSGRSAVKVSPVWGSDRGLTQIPGSPAYVYLTPSKLSPPETITDTSDTETATTGAERSVCPQSLVQSPVVPQFRMFCWSRQSPWMDGAALSDTTAPTGRTAEIGWRLPILVAAIDPVAEAKLAGLNKAVTSGRYLRESDHPDKDLNVPVLVASTSPVDLTLTVHAAAVSSHTAATIGTGASPEQLDRATATQPLGPVVARVSYPQVYSRFLQQLTHPKTSSLFSTWVVKYWSGSSVSYTDHGGVLAPKAVVNPDSVWNTPNYIGWAPRAAVPTAETNYRTMTGHASKDPSVTIGFHSVGTFDAARIPGVDPLTAVPYGTYQSPVVTAADPAAAAALRGRSLAPDSSLTGYLQTPPTMFTTMAGAQEFFGSGWAHNAGVAPISSIRVRVAGVTGASDSVSRARVQQVAAALEAETGLQVDVLLGSSPAPQTITLPAGKFGRPALAVRENWVRLGVATEIVSAVNRKSAILFLLVLIVCAVVVANAAFASVRSRITELAVLSCLGWRPLRLFGLVTGELMLLGAAAGVLSAVLAIPIGHLAGVPVTWQRALFALPVATVLAVVAGLPPAVSAARAAPIEAVRATARMPRRATRVRSVAGLAVTTMARRPGRNALAAGGLAVAVAAFTLLLAVTLAFQGSVVGSLLGNAVTVQVRGVDYAATAAILFLSGLGVADVLFVSLTERAVEFATLRAVGWRERRLRELVLTEGTVLGLVGSAVGAVVGLTGSALFLTFTPRLVLGAVLAFAAGVVIAVVASLLTLSGLRAGRTVEALAGAE